MPPVTSQSRFYPSNCCKSSNQTKGKQNNSSSSFRRRKPRTTSKSNHKGCRRDMNLEKSETKRISYDRDFLLFLRNSAPSNQKPELPSIPGVTAPKLKRKEMPESLRQKLLKRGVIIVEQKENDVDEQCSSFEKLSLKEKSLNGDMIWQSCIYNIL